MTAKKDKHDMPPTRFEDADDRLLESPLISDDAALITPEKVAELHKQIEELNSSLQEAKSKSDAYWDRLVRKEADFQNLERRAQIDVENARKFAIERFAQELLQVLDSFDQGLAYGQNDPGALEHIVEGMLLTRNLLASALEKHGVTEVNPVGEPFNPNFHEALTMQESQEIPPNHVVSVIQKGYMLNNRVLRPARVIVSKKS